MGKATDQTLAADTTSSTRPTSDNIDAKSAAEIMLGSDPITAGSQSVVVHNTIQSAALVSESNPSAVLEATMPPEGDVEATKAHIERTRAAMSSTIDAIKNKISLQNMAEEAKASARTAVNDKIEHVKRTVEPMVNSARRKANDALRTAKREIQDPQQAMRKAAKGVSETAKKRPGLVAAIAGGLLVILIRNHRRNVSRDRHNRR